MQIEGSVALVTGGGSGLGEAVARALAARGARVGVLDRRMEAAQRVAEAIGGVALACDITDEDGAAQALAELGARLGPPRILMNIAGIGGARRVIDKTGRPAPLADFRHTVEVNLVGTYNMVRLFAAGAAALAPVNGEGERGVVVNTASVAAFDGQVGQEAYAASKGGIVALTLPLARDLASFGIRVLTLAPGIFHTPLLAELPEPVQQSLAAAIPFPKRLGRPEEFAALALHAVENGHLNGEVIRIDGALRLAPR